MAPFDYSKFDKIDCSDSEDEGADKEKSAISQDILSELPPELRSRPDLAMVLAAREGQQHMVEGLLNSRVEVDTRDPHGRTALLCAVEAGAASRSIVETLLKRNASPDARCTGGDTPLTRAAAVGPTELLDALMENRSSDLEIRGEALVSAAKAGNVGTTKLLLNSGAMLNVKQRSDGRTALHCWSEHGNTDMIDVLLKARADINASDTNGETPLISASRKGASAVVANLCKRGASIDDVALEGRTALSSAAELKEDSGAEIINTLLAHNASVDLPLAQSGLVIAAGAGRGSVVSRLLSANASVDTADSCGRRALPCAALGGSPEVCRILLDARADVNARGTGGKGSEGEGVTALCIAVATGNAALIDLLLKENADLEMVDERGLTPLLSAAVLGRVEALKTLIGARANSDAKDSADKTALVLAAATGHSTMCSALVGAGANVNAKASTGVASIHAAAANGHMEVCKILLAAGASATELGPGGRNAGCLAEVAGHTELADLLKAS